MRNRTTHLALSFALAFAVGCGGQTDLSEDGTAEESLANDPADAITDAEIDQLVASLDAPPSGSAGQQFSLDSLQSDPVAQVSSTVCDYACGTTGAAICALLGGGAWGAFACGVGSIPACKGICSRGGPRPLPWPAGSRCLTRIGLGWPKFKKDMAGPDGKDVRVYTVHWGYTGQWGTAVVIRDYTRPEPIWVAYDIEHGGHHKTGFKQYRC